MSGDEGIRVNVTISAEAYYAMIEMAGGQRRMGQWLNSTILALHHERMPDPAIDKMAELRDYLNKFFEAREARLNHTKKKPTKKAGS